MNYVTEAQAAEKRCCGPTGAGKYDAAKDIRRCAGNGCMAWRWQDATHTFEDVLVRESEASKTARASFSGITPAWTPTFETAEESVSGRRDGLRERGFTPTGKYKHSQYQDRWEVWSKEFGPDRTGYCGLAEPRLAEVSISS